MKKKPKKPQNSTKKKLPSILDTDLLDEFVATNPITETFIDELCKRLINYSRRDDALFIEGFIRETGLNHKSFYRWIDEWPQLKDAAEQAKFNIAYGRAEGVIKKKYDKGMVLYTQHRFGKEWREDDAYQAELKKVSQEEQAPNIQVIMPQHEEVIDRNKYKPITSNDDDGK